MKNIRFASFLKRPTFIVARKDSKLFHEICQNSNIEIGLNGFGEVEFSVRWDWEKLKTLAMEEVNLIYHRSIKSGLQKLKVTSSQNSESFSTFRPKSSNTGSRKWTMSEHFRFVKCHSISDTVTIAVFTRAFSGISTLI